MSKLLNDDNFTKFVLFVTEENKRLVIAKKERREIMDKKWEEAQEEFKDIWDKSPDNDKNKNFLARFFSSETINDLNEQIARLEHLKKFYNNMEPDKINYDPIAVTINNFCVYLANQTKGVKMAYRDRVTS